ncbi:hypothetical protein P8452_06596 [Trifolium repens]|nr:hypothetical protein P8452_06596 [Trifolium repens]
MTELHPKQRLLRLRLHPNQSRQQPKRGPRTDPNTKTRKNPAGERDNRRRRRKNGPDHFRWSTEKQEKEIGKKKKPQSQEGSDRDAAKRRPSTPTSPPHFTTPSPPQQTEFQNTKSPRTRNLHHRGRTNRVSDRRDKQNTKSSKTT